MLAELGQDQADLPGLLAEIKRLEDELADLRQQGIQLERAIGDDNQLAGSVLGESEKKLAKDIVELRSMPGRRPSWRRLSSR